MDGLFSRDHKIEFIVFYLESQDRKVFLDFFVSLLSTELYRKPLMISNRVDRRPFSVVIC